MKKDIEVLKEVFTYGYATDTHLDIVCYLNIIGVPEEEYSQWGRNASQPTVEADAESCVHPIGRRTPSLRCDQCGKQL